VIPVTDRLFPKVAWEHFIIIWKVD
jgi:hypothetical protein